MIEMNDEDANDDERTVIEIEPEESKDEVIFEDTSEEKKAGKQRAFVKLLNRSALGESLEEVNDILVGIEKELSENDKEHNLDEDLKSNYELSTKQDESSSEGSSEKTWKPHGAKKGITFSLPDLETPKTNGTPSEADDIAVIEEEQSISSEATVTEIPENIMENKSELSAPTQKERIEVKCREIEKSLGKISKQKYFSNLDGKRQKEFSETETGVEKEGVKKVCEPKVETSKSLYSYPDLTPSVYR